MKTLFLFLISLIFIFTIEGRAQIDSNSLKMDVPCPIQWVSIEKAQELSQINQKPILIDFYTDWCGWCKYMIKVTYSNPSIAQYININFNPVKFNAESKDTITFLGKKYFNVKTGPRANHNFAIEILDGKMTFPSTVILHNNYKFKLIVPGYLPPSDIEPILVYTVEYVFNTTKFEDFKKYYTEVAYNQKNETDTFNTNWITFQSALMQNGESPKKTMMFINTDWCNSGKIMILSNFKDSAITTYINEKFHTVFFDPLLKDTIYFKDEKFYVDEKYGIFHSFATKIFEGRVILPSIVIFDPNFDVITTISQYYTPEELEIILHYFGDDAYKTSEWKEYQNSYKLSNRK